MHFLIAFLISKIYSIFILFFMLVGADFRSTRATASKLFTSSSFTLSVSVKRAKRCAKPCGRSSKLSRRIRYKQRIKARLLLFASFPLQRNALLLCGAVHGVPRALELLLGHRGERGKGARLRLRQRRKHFTIHAHIRQIQAKYQSRVTKAMRFRRRIDLLYPKSSHVSFLFLSTLKTNFFFFKKKKKI